MTAELVKESFIKSKTEKRIIKGMIFYSYLGSKYTSKEYKKY